MYDEHEGIEQAIQPDGGVGVDSVFAVESVVDRVVVSMVVVVGVVAVGVASVVVVERVDAVAMSERVEE